MQKWIGISFVVPLVVLVLPSYGDDVPGAITPTEQHQWLEQFAGEWEVETEINIPGQEPIKCTGTESAHMLGGLWLVAEGQGEMLGTPFNSVFTLGYDSTRGKYVGTWVDSCTGYLWTYEGTLDDSGRALTLETQGPCPMRNGEIVSIRETLELVDDDHKLFKSSVQDEDGTWQTVVTVQSSRKE